jgi:hypothetical protein
MPSKLNLPAIVDGLLNTRIYSFSFLHTLCMQQRHEYMGFWDNVVAYVGIYIIDIIYCRHLKPRRQCMKCIITRQYIVYLWQHI